jgi:hypothetical protein
MYDARKHTQRMYLIAQLRAMFPQVQYHDASFGEDTETLTITLDGRTYAMEIGSDDDAYCFEAPGCAPIRIPFERVDDFVYDRVFTEVQSLPTTATEEEIDEICALKGYRAEGMTDQIDIYRKGRRIACYMAGA